VDLPEGRIEIGNELRTNGVRIAFFAAGSPRGHHAPSAAVGDSGHSVDSSSDSECSSGSSPRASLQSSATSLAEQLRQVRFQSLSLPFPLIDNVKFRNQTAQ